MLILDSSGILAALNARDPHHREAVSALGEVGGPFIVPAGMMAETAYMINLRLGAHVMDAFLGDLDSGAFTLDCGEGDLPRIRALLQRYHDLPLGYADAAVIACAERLDGRVLTFDLRDFGVVAREGTIRIAGFEAE